MKPWIIRIEKYKNCSALLQFQLLYALLKSANSDLQWHMNLSSAWEQTNPNIIVLTKSGYTSRVLFQGEVQALSIRRSDEKCLVFVLLAMPCFHKPSPLRKWRKCFSSAFLSRSTVWHTPNSKHWEFQHQVMKIYVIFMRQTLVSFVKSSFELTFPKASQDAQLQENNFESKRRKDLFRLHLLAQSFLTSDSTAVHCVRKLRRSSFVSAFKNSTCP